LRNSPRVQPVLLGDKHTEAIKTREYQQGRLTQADTTNFESNFSSC
jgi:hypothetical protein